MPGTTNGAIATNPSTRANGNNWRVLAYEPINARTETIVAAAAAYRRLCPIAARAAWLSTSAQRYQSSVRLPGTGPLPQARDNEVASSAPYGSTKDSNGGMQQSTNSGHSQAQSWNGSRAVPRPPTVVNRRRPSRRRWRSNPPAATSSSGIAYAAARFGRLGNWKNR